MLTVSITSVQTTYVSGTFFLTKITTITTTTTTVLMGFDTIEINLVNLKTTFKLFKQL